MEFEAKPKRKTHTNVTREKNEGKKRQQQLQRNFRPALDRHFECNPCAALANFSSHPSALHIHTSHLHFTNRPSQLNESNLKASPTYAAVQRIAAYNATDAVTIFIEQRMRARFKFQKK